MVNVTDLDYLKSKFAIFLNCISDEDFKVIIDTLYFRASKKAQKSINDSSKKEQINLMIADMDFSIKDRKYISLINILYQHFRERIAVDQLSSMDDVINDINPENFIENTIYIIYKFCKPPYSGKLKNIFESRQFSICVSRDIFINADNSKDYNAKENIMKYYIGYIEKRGTYYNFKPEFIFDGVQIAKDDTLKECFPKHGKFNLSYKFHKESEQFLESVKLYNLYAVNAENLSIKDNRSYSDNSIVEDVQKQIDIQEMYDNSIDVSKVIFLAEKLGIFKVASPTITEIDNNFIDGTIEISNQNYDKNDYVLISHKDKLIGPYQLEVRPIDKTQYVKPNLGNSINKYIKKYIDNYNNERVFSFSIYIDYYTTEKIDFAYFDKNAIQSEDIIPDEILLSELNKIYNIDTESKGKTAFDRLTKNSEFLSSDLSTEVRKSRLSRVETQFETFDTLIESKKTVLKTLINSDWGKIEDSQLKRMLDEKLENSDEYKSLLEKYDQSTKDYDILQNQKQNIEMELSELKEVQSQDRLTEQKAKEKQTENDQLTLSNENLKKENTELESRKISLQKEVDDLEQIKDLQKEKTELEGTIKYLHNQKDELNSKVRKARNEFRSEIEKSMNEAKLAFDPVISNMMLDSASQWQNKDKSNKYLSYCNCVDTIAKSTISKSEEELSDYIISGVRKYRNYQYNDIINMYICITQSFLTIFAGNPGTGKTSICNIIANSLGLNRALDENNSDIMRFIPVSVERGWSSKRDLIGYYNPLTKKYDKSNGKIYDALRVLDNEKDNSSFPMLVLLDEANLSPIEYYWAEFMRIADRENDSAKINIGEENDLFIPETLRFVATINYDQTTEELSPRLIDRAWIIKLPSIEMDYSKKPDIKTVFTDLILWSDLKEMFLPKTTDTKIESADVLEQIYEEFSNAGIPISYRVKESIYNYVLVAQRLMIDETSANAKHQAIDYAVMQKLLPKINGNGYKDFLERLVKICDDNRLIKTRNSIDEMLTQAEYNLGYCQYL